MKNYELGRKILDIADSSPGRFDMRTWGRPSESCGTVACLAGHAMLESGYELRSLNLDRDPAVAPEDLCCWYFRPDGTKVHNESNEAAELLGMNPSEMYTEVLGMNPPEMYTEGTFRPVFTDSRNGLARFRRMVEKSERKAAEDAQGN